MLKLVTLKIKDNLHEVRRVRVLEGRAEMIARDVEPGVTYTAVFDGRYVEFSEDRKSNDSITASRVLGSVRAPDHTRNGRYVRFQHVMGDVTIWPPVDVAG